MSPFDRRATGSAAPTVREVNWPPVEDDPRPRSNQAWGQPQLSAPPNTVAPRPVTPRPVVQHPVTQNPVAPDWDDENYWNQPPPIRTPRTNGAAEESTTHGYDDHQAWGRPAWQALLVLAGITAIGVVIDVVRDGTGGVNIAIIVASLIAILIVRRLAMFPVVIAPPLVYMLGSAGVLYLRSGGPHNKAVLIDIATNWLVYGFPAMAAASAVVLIVAGVRMIIKR